MAFAHYHMRLIVDAIHRLTPQLVATPVQPSAIVSPCRRAILVYHIPVLISLYAESARAYCYERGRRDYSRAMIAVFAGRHN